MIVREQDLLRHLTVPPDSLTDAQYEQAIQAMCERQRYGDKNTVNFASTVFMKGERPNRMWTNHRDDYEHIDTAIAKVMKGDGDASSEIDDQLKEMANLGKKTELQDKIIAAQETKLIELELKLAALTRPQQAQVTPPAGKLNLKNSV